MVDAVGTVSVQVSAAKSAARSTSSATATSSVVSASSGDSFVSSAIRVDNLQNVAILEYRSSDGEILQQYPTQAQIDAFTRARALERRELFSSNQAEAAPSASAPDVAVHTAPAVNSDAGVSVSQQPPSGASVEA